MREFNFSELCKFTDKQWLATTTADAYRYMLFGGSRGPGKSYWLRWYMLRLLLKYAANGLRNVNVLLACEDYPSLTGRQITKIETEFPAWLGEVGSTKAKGLGFHLKPRYGGGSILLRNLDDPSKYQSFEFAAIAIDELTKNPLSTFNILRGSMRWPGISFTQFVAATNPEANWVRDYWIERKFPKELERVADQFSFVSALPNDNPHLSETYWQELETLSGALRDAWLYGDWYAGIEGLVYANFSIANVTDEEPDTSKPYELAIDDGYIDPRATLFIQRKSNGDVLVFDELYHSMHLEEQTIDKIKGCEEGEGKKAIAGKIKEHGFEQLPRVAYVSHEAVTLRKRLNDAQIPARNWMQHKAGGSGSTRLEAIKMTRSLFCDGNQYRAIKVHRRCENLLKEIRGTYKYPEGKHGFETEPADGGDHACQALESWVWANFGKRSTMA